jgi:hypothetical protein
LAARKGPVVAEASVPPEHRYRNALLWIRTIAGMHYFGGAFNPEHMRALANLAADALDGKNLPDYREHIAAAQEHGREMAARWSELLDNDAADEEADRA